MALAGLDALIAALCASTRDQRSFYKASATTEGAGTFHSFWKVPGNYPGAGATPPAYTSGSGYIPTEATAGAFPLTNPGGANTKYMALVSPNASASQKLILYDRVWHCSGFVTNSTGTQTITTPGNVTRPANGVGVEPWVEIYTAPGATGATWTFNFTDSDDAAAVATYTHPANAETVGQICPLIMPVGCRGVKSPTSFVCSTTSGTAGDVGITLMKRAAEVTVAPSNIGLVHTALMLGIPGLLANTCLAMATYAPASATGFVSGTLIYCEG